MKKAFILAICSLSLNSSFSQSEETLQTVTNRGNASFTTDPERYIFIGQSATAGNSLVLAWRYNNNAPYSLVEPYGGAGNLILGGNVGIGLTSPAYKLDVNGTGNFSGSLTQNGHQVWHAGNLKPSKQAYYLSADLNTYVDPGLYEYDGVGNAVINGPSGSPNYRVLSLGNSNRQSQMAFSYGLDQVFFRRNDDGAYGGWKEFWHSGNFVPGTKADVHSSAGFDGNRSLDISSIGKLFNATNYPVPYGMYMDIGSGMYKLQFNSAHTKNGNVYLKVSGDGGEGDWQTIYHSGNLNISNFLPVSGGEMTGNLTIGSINSQKNLAVNGNIKTRKVKVTLTDWPDYVFDSSYKLPSLHHLEEYIQSNKHLPDIPSATEVKKEGLDIGDNQAMLLRKIEELTLYVIQQSKEISQMRQEITELKDNSLSNKSKQQ